MTDYLYYIILILCFFVFGFFLILLIYHLFIRFREKKFFQKQKEWEPILDAFLNEEFGVNEAVAKIDKEYLYLFRFLKPYLSTVNESNFCRLKQLAEKLGMIDFFLERLEEGSRDEKVKAIIFLGRIKERRALLQIKEYLHSNDELIMTASIWAIADIGEIEFFIPILSTILIKTSMTFESLTEFAIEFGEDVCFPIVDLLQEWITGQKDFADVFQVPEYQVISLFIDILGYFRFKPSVGLMVQILSPDYNQEVLIHIFKALVKIKEVIEIDLEPYLFHDNWVIRSQAAKYVGVTEIDGYIDGLVNLMEDSKWWVRYYAGRSLLMMGQNNLLREIIAHQEAGADMSKYILEQMESDLISGGDQMEFLNFALLTVDYLAITYFLLVHGTYLLLNILAFFSIRKHWLSKQVSNFDRLFQSDFYKPVTIIIPAYNEAETIVDNVKSILSLNYPEFEVVVVNDGSNDRTMEELEEYFNLTPSSRNYNSELETAEIVALFDSLEYSNLVIVDKKNGGKADALNTGINIAQFPLVCNIDADSLIDEQALLSIVEPFARDWQVVAAGGTIRVANDCEIEESQIKQVNLSKRPIVRIQVIEYLRAFLFGRVGWASLNSLLIISGAFGVFRRKHLLSVGGYSTETVGEDMELVLKLNRQLQNEKRDYRVVFFPDPVCWTQVPEDIKTLASQRRRWQRGLGESLLINKDLLFNYNYGILGLLGVPFYFFVEFLGPIIEVIGYLAIILTVIFGTGIENVLLLFLITSILMGILLSTISLFFEEMTFRKYEWTSDVLALFWYCLVESFGYKQLHTFWRLQGIVDLLIKKEGWGSQNRKSFGGKQMIDDR